MAGSVNKCLLVLLGSVLFFGTGQAQPGLCPPNLDFEQGDFSNWSCRGGLVSVSGGINTISWTSSGPQPTLHNIISAANSGADPYGGFPTLCPNGSGYSVKLGNETATGNGGVGREAAGVTYSFTIPSSSTNFSIFFYYAIVLQNPGHAPEEQPRFRARIRDMSSGNTIPCVTFDFTASSSLPGFRPSAVDPSVQYKDWTPITLNLSSYAGRTLELEFITTECTRQGHFGYAYVDVNSYCNGAITGNIICPGAPGITLTAPFGFQAYTWYSDPTFTTILSTNQTLPLFPPPPVGTVFPVVVEPFPGFGCRDTLYATVEVTSPPVSVAGPDITLCRGGTAQIGGPPVSGYTYAWVPAGEVSNPSISDPIALPATGNPTEFIVTTTDRLSGCSSKDTVIVSTYRVDTTINLNGLPDFCENETGPTLSVNPGSSSVQWYEVSTGPIAGAIGATYRPAASGSFWARVGQGGCLDTTRAIPVFQHALPNVSFTPDNDTGCVTRNSFTFTNGSVAPDNASMSYLWRFSDGTTDPATDPVKRFARTGSYRVRLITTTQFGCKDSTEQTVHVLPNGIPNFTWDSICTTRPVTFTNRSQENGSPRVTYLWDFNNGGPLSALRNPLPVVYTAPPGQRTVTLKLAALGCENDTQTVVRTVQVNEQEPGARYREITVPQRSSQFLKARDTIGHSYRWRPSLHLSSTNTRFTEFFANGDDMLYYIDISDIHTCVTTDTQQVRVLKKPGYYLPSAFTPNKDGLNDLLRPYLIGMNGLRSFSIFNRWGQLIFFTQTYGDGWNGTFKGVDQAAGVYVWVLEFYDADNRLVKERGTITVIR